MSERRTKVDLHKQLLATSELLVMAASQLERELALYDLCRLARNRLRANAASQKRMAAKSGKYEYRLRREASARAYSAAARLLDGVLK